MSKKLILFFMYRTFGGGSTSYTVHLYRSLQLAGYEPEIWRVKERGEEFLRPFSKYEDVEYRNVTPREAKKAVKNYPTLMTAPCKSRELPFDPKIIPDLIKRGMRVVVHDPNEFKIYDHLNRKFDQRPICIRPSMHKFFPEAKFIPHPYVREFKCNQALPHEGRDHLAISVARVTFVKRTDLILEANRILKEEGSKDRVILRGAENRLYTRHVILPKYPEYKQGRTGFPMTWGAAARECEKAVFAVDFTYFPDDGGGSQYSFMEAWDAGTVNIIHKDWMRIEGEMYPHPTDRASGNCLAVRNPRELADYLRLYRNSSRLRADCFEIASNGFTSLERHDPVRIANEYWKELNRE